MLPAASRDDSEVGNGPLEEGRKDLGGGLARGGGQLWKAADGDHDGILLCLDLDPDRGSSAGSHGGRLLSSPFYPTIHLPSIETWRLSRLRHHRKHCARPQIYTRRRRR